MQLTFKQQTQSLAIEKSSADETAKKYLNEISATMYGFNSRVRRIEHDEIRGQSSRC
jgi:hypothetical protein